MENIRLGDMLFVTRKILDECSSILVDNNSRLFAESVGAFVFYHFKRPVLKFRTTALTDQYASIPNSMLELVSRKMNQK